MNDIIQAELIQSVIGVGAVKTIKLDLEAVAVIAIGFHLGQRGVALGADGDVRIGFVINDNGAGRIFLAFTTFDKFVPIVHTDIDRVHRGGGKELILISHDGGGLFYTKTLGVEKENHQKQRERKDNTANQIKMLMCRHGWPPYPIYSPL